MNQDDILHFFQSELSRHVDMKNTSKHYTGNVYSKFFPSGEYAYQQLEGFAEWLHTQIGELSKDAKTRAIRKNHGILCVISDDPSQSVFELCDNFAK